MGTKISDSRLIVWLSFFVLAGLIGGGILLLTKDSNKPIPDNSEISGKSTGGRLGPNHSQNRDASDPHRTPADPLDPNSPAFQKAMKAETRRREVEQIKRLLWTSKDLKEHVKALDGIRKLGEMGEFDTLAELFQSDEWYARTDKALGGGLGGMQYMRVVDLEEQRIAIEMAMTGDPRAEKMILDKFVKLDGDPRLHSRSRNPGLLGALSYVKSPSARSYDVLIGLLERNLKKDEDPNAWARDPEIAYRQTTASWSMGVLGRMDTDQAKGILERMIYDPDTPQRVRTGVIAVLSNAPSLRNIRTLGKVLENSNDPTIRQHAAGILGLMFAGNPFHWKHEDRYRRQPTVSEWRAALSVAESALARETNREVRNALANAMMGWRSQIRRAEQSMEKEGK